MHEYILKPAVWSSSNTFVSGAGGLRFKSRAGQKSNTLLPTARHRCDISSKKAMLPTGAVTQSCKSGRDFRVDFGFGLDIDKMSELIRA